MSATATLVSPLRIGRHTIGSPVVLAPMAGITNRAFRRLCREYGVGGLEDGGDVGATSLYVSEMITSRALVERNARDDAAHRARPRREPAVDPALRRRPGHRPGRGRGMLVTEDRADHIDLNFGCPVPKVTRKGGGAALPWKRDLFRGIVGAVVRGGRPPTTCRSP